MTPEVLEMLEAGRRIAAIRQYRLDARAAGIDGIGLAEAQTIIDAHIGDKS